MQALNVLGMSALGGAIALIFEQVEALDLAGPWQVFASSAAARAGENAGADTVVTSQGVSAGIDMALWLVGRIHGRDHSRFVRRKIQYEPAAPYMADETLSF